MPKQTGYTRVGPGLPPVCGAQASALILGSFPSPKSREQGFFYGHPQNRFWPLLAGLTGAPVPAWEDIEAKKRIITQNGLALWDVIRCCSIRGASDASIKDPVPVDLAALLKEVNQNMTVNARKAYVTLQYDARPATVLGSHDLLLELTTNLCDNAIRYNRPGGHVNLRCGAGTDGAPWLEVEDNGIGIPQDSQSRVFERFYRVDKSRSKATGGTGLGLAIVKHIAVLHGARIELHSTVGTGTTIRVTFPPVETPAENS